MALAGILLEIEELLAVEARKPHELSQAVCDVLHFLLGRVTRTVFAMNIVTPCDAGPLHQRKHACAIDGPRNVQAGDRQDRRHDVSEFDHLARNCVLRARDRQRRDDQHRDSGAPLVGVCLSPEVVVSEHVAVVGGKDEPSTF